MSEQEFELYLSLLSRLLRLDPAQREQIADELRDHFEERLDELVRLGHSRPAAIQLALEEFGDAAGLAAHFSHISHRRKRRLIMRCTLGTIAGMAAALLLIAALWPDTAPLPVNGRAVAQQVAPNPLQAPPAKSGLDARRAAVEEKLDMRLKDVDFIEVAIGDVFDWLAEKASVDILVNKSYFADMGFTLDVPITLQIKHADVAVRTVLEMALEHLSPSDVGYVVRDGLVYITSNDDADEIRVYNCRDLITSHDSSGGAMPGSPSGMMPGMGGFGGGSAGMMPGGMGGLGGGVGDAYSGLIHVITSTIHPDTWAVNGGSGSIEQYNGLLIAKQRQAVHREIKELLDQIRAVSRESQQP